MTRLARFAAPALLLAACLAFAAAGCKTYAPGSEKAVVDSEDSVTAAFHVVRDDENWAQLHRNEMRQKSPDADKAFEQVRKDDEPTFSAAWGAVHVYKETRSAEARATMLQKVDAANALRTKAETATAQAKAAGVGNNGNNP
jgi:hypothetical protein